MCHHPLFVSLLFILGLSACQTKTLLCPSPCKDQATATPTAISYQTPFATPSATWPVTLTATPTWSETRTATATPTQTTSPTPSRTATGTSTPINLSPTTTRTPAYACPTIGYGSPTATMTPQDGDEFHVAGRFVDDLTVHPIAAGASITLLSFYIERPVSFGADFFFESLDFNVTGTGNDPIGIAEVQLECAGTILSSKTFPTDNGTVKLNARPFQGFLYSPGNFTVTVRFASTGSTGTYQFTNPHLTVTQDCGVTRLVSDETYYDTFSTSISSIYSVYNP